MRGKEIDVCYSLLWGLYSTVYKLKCVELIIPQITIACITDAATTCLMTTSMCDLLPEHYIVGAVASGFNNSTTTCTAFDV